MMRLTNTILAQPGDMNFFTDLFNGVLNSLGTNISSNVVRFTNMVLWGRRLHGFLWGLLRSKDHLFTKLTNGGKSMSKHPWSIRSWEAAFSSQTEAGFQAGHTELGWKHPLNKNWLESRHFFCLVKRYLLWDKKSHLPIMILTTLGGCK